VPFVLFVTVALAGDATCAACCAAGGLGRCDTELRVRTESSRLDPSGMDTRVQGTWRLACDGSGRFDVGDTVEVDHEPEYGEVLQSGQNPLAVHCFAEACSLPRGVCVGPANFNGDVRLVGCIDGMPASQADLAAAPGRAPGPGAVVVVIDGRPLVAEPPASGPADAPAVEAPTIGSPPAPGPLPAPAAAASPRPAPGPVALALPDDPPDPCPAAADAIRAEARKRVGSGDDSRMAGRADDALRDYKAALTLDRCNGYAWMSIAQLTVDAGRTDLSIRALKNATRLVPRYPPAWVILARAYEAIGQRSMAAEAWRTASALAPGNAEAVEGYMRTR
jgi:hypothetical protein